MKIEDILEAHENVVFMCSGGKDSVAALYYLKDYWQHFTVAWINTGNLPKEVVEFMHGVRSMVPHFMEYKRDSYAWAEEYGWPSPVVPQDYTTLGQIATGKKEITISSYLDCCRANIWESVPIICEYLEATAVLNGQRKEDSTKDPRESGTWHRGVQYFRPIDDWTIEEVHAFLKKNGITDPRFYGDDTSIDCLHCTGYPQFKKRTQYIKENHPDWYNEINRRWTLIKAATNEATNEI